MPMPRLLRPATSILLAGLALPVHAKYVTGFWGIIVMLGSLPVLAIMAMLAVVLRATPLGARSWAVGGFRLLVMAALMLSVQIVSSANETVSFVLVLGLNGAAATLLWRAVSHPESGPGSAGEPNNADSTQSARTDER